MKALIPSTLLIFCLTAAYADPNKPIIFPLSEILYGREVYFASISGIEWTNSDLMIIGTAGNKKSLSSDVILNIYLNCKETEKDPACVFEHTHEEDQAYEEFHEKFKVLPRGYTGVKYVIEWKRNNFKQYVKISNVDKNVPFSKVLFNADITLKKMILGKKNVPAKKMDSFISFAESHLQDKMDENRGFFSYHYETVFYLLPIKITVYKKSNSIEVKDVDFALQSKSEYEGQIGRENSLENEWAKNFSNNYKTISAKVNELSIMNEAYKLYALFKLARKQIQLDSLRYGRINPIENEIPDSIPSIKFYEFIETPDPLINEPGRFKFLWFMISGGIIFRSPGKDVQVEEISSRVH